MSRYYDAGIGRFLIRDNYYAFEKKPQTLDIYVYCVNNPIMFTDPSGNFSISHNFYIGSGGYIDVGANGNVSDWGLKGNIGVNAHVHLTASSIVLMFGEYAIQFGIDAKVSDFLLKNTYLDEILLRIFKVKFIAGRVSYAINKILSYTVCVPALT